MYRPTAYNIDPVDGRPIPAPVPEEPRVYADDPNVAPRIPLAVKAARYRRFGR